jgi:hypothetical protein
MAWSSRRDPENLLGNAEHISNHLIFQRRAGYCQGSCHSEKGSAGNLHAAFDEAGTGSVTMGAGLRPTAKAFDTPPATPVGAPVLYPVGEGVVVQFSRANRCFL